MVNLELFPVEPWSVTETAVTQADLATTETIFALSNGHIGLRGNLDEGEPFGVPGSLLNGFFEFIPMPYAESGYGYPDRGQTLINVTNGKVIRLLVDDEPFDIRYGHVHSHSRRLDLRAGTLTREIEWTSPAGKRIQMQSVRLVSLEHRAVAGIQMKITAVDRPVRLVIQSTLVANEPQQEKIADPRAAQALEAPLKPEFQATWEQRVTLGHSTRASHLNLVASMDHEYEAPNGTDTTTFAAEDLGRVTYNTELQAGESFTVNKYLGYGWSTTRSMPALRDQVEGAIFAAKSEGWDRLLDDQRAWLDQFWVHADIEIDGDDQLQQAVRFAIFQAIQASARAERRPIPAKGLTARGYDGHTFWDQETFLLPELTYIAPKQARDALLWRHFTLDKARKRAQELQLAGASFPWRTIQGDECSGYWPAGTAAFHINADIADAARRYYLATEDKNFARHEGFDILVETARLWMSVGHHDAEGMFRIDGVTGPDEYTALIDNNVFTNLMAARNLRAAAKLVERVPERREDLNVTDEEVAAWLNAAEHMVIPFDHELEVTQQSEGFTRYRDWDFEGTPAESYPLLLHYPYYLLYSSQVIKQADLVMALYTCGDCFSEEQKRKDFEFYEAITVRDSSLSASTQAIVAAELGFFDLAYEYFRETALIDLHDLAENTRDGIHLAASAATWLVAVAGFGGMRDHSDQLEFAPRLPEQLTRIRFRMVYRDRHLRVTLQNREATYELMKGDSLSIRHEGEDLTLTADEPVTVPMRDVPPLPTPPRPYGRESDAYKVGSGISSTDISLQNIRSRLAK